MDTERMAERALELSAFANSTTRYSNSVVLFTLFLLQDMLETQASDPQTNMSNILSISNTIAALSLSLRI